MSAHIIRLPKRVKESGPPRVVCPLCQEVIEINLDIWKKNVSELFKAKCYKCHGEVFMGLLLLAHSDIKGLLANIQKIIETVNPRNRIIGGS